MARIRPGTVLGTMEFGRGPCVGSVPSDMVNTFLSFDPSYRHLDTALMYSGGKSEQIIGEMKNWRECGGLGNILVSDWSDRLKKLTLLSDWL